MKQEVMKIVEDLSSKLKVLEQQLEDYRAVDNFMDAIVTQVKITETHLHRNDLIRLL